MCSSSANSHILNEPYIYDMHVQQGGEAYYFNAFLAPIDTPKNVGLDKDKVIKVHSGFKSE
jgi:hypothetical protein